MVACQAVAGKAGAEAGDRSSVGAGPEGTPRDLVRPEHRHPVGVPAQELDYGSGTTCWRRLAAWNEAGVWVSWAWYCWRRCGSRRSWTGRGRWATPPRPGPLYGAQKRAQAGRPRTSGQQAPPHYADPFGETRLRRSPTSLDGHATDPTASSSTAAAPRQIPLPRLGTGHQSGDRPPRRPTRIRTRRTSAGPWSEPRHGFTASADYG